MTDDYRWLENGDDPSVKAWSEAQNTHAREVLDALVNRTAIRERITELHGGDVGYSGMTWSGGKLLALKRESSKEQPFLVTLNGPNDLESERIVVDPLTLDRKGGTAIDWYVASPDGSKVAVSLSEGGSERGDLHVFETMTGKDIAEVIPHVNNGTAGGSLAWAGDSSGFYYTRYPRPGERAIKNLDFYTQVYYHALGTRTEADRYEIGKDFPRIAEIALTTSRDGRFNLANVANGDGGEFAQFLRSPGGEWTQLTTFKDDVAYGVFGEDGSLYFLSRNGAARGKILRLVLTADSSPRMSEATVVVPESSDAVIAFTFYGADSIVSTKSRLYVIDLVGGPNRVRMFNPTGRPLGTLALPPVSAVSELVPFRGDTVL